MSIFTHVAVGTNDLDKARLFYDDVLGTLGISRMFDGETSTFYGSLENGAIMVTKPADGKGATRANGGTIGLGAGSRAAVDAFHAAALRHGGTCDGAPGPRPHAPNAYGAYIRDPDGNKFCAYSYVPE